MADNGDEAKELLRDHYASLASSITAPVLLGQELFQYRVIGEHSLNEIDTEGHPIDRQNTDNTASLCESCRSTRSR